MQCVLLGELLVLLQKQDDKMVLKCHSKSNIAVPEGKQMLSPIIKLDSVFLREVATGQLHTVVFHTVTVTSIVRSILFNSQVAFLFFFFLPDNKAFYVIFTWESGAQIYELVAQSVAERKM